MNSTYPNLLLVSAFFKAYADHNLEGMKLVMDDRIRWHIPGKHPLSGIKTGLDEVLEYFSQLNKSHFKAEPIVMGVNDHFVIDCHRNWSNADSGDNLKSMSCLLWRIENNKIVEVFNFPEDQYKVDEFFNKQY